MKSLRYIAAYFGVTSFMCLITSMNICNAQGGYWLIMARNSGLVLNVDGASMSDGAGIIQFPISQTYNEQWEISPVGGGFYKITARHSGKSLNVDGNSSDDGRRIIQWPYGGQPNMQFRIERASNQFPEFRIRARNSGKVLNVNGNTNAPRAPIIQWPETGQLNEKFTFRRVLVRSDGSFRYDTNDLDILNIVK